VNTDGLKKLWKIVFGDPDSFIDTFFEVAFSPDRCRCMEENGQIISALYWFDCSYDGGKLAYIYAVATHPEHRGKGLASRLLEETHDHLKAQGYAGCVLKPAEGLFPYYARLGYVTSGFVRRFAAEAGSKPAQIRELSPAEYSRLRREYLPEDGIVQEGITLEFLHTFAKLYASNDANGS
jgi:predicted acetyltransferase